MQIHQNGTSETDLYHGHHKMPTSTKDIVEKVNNPHFTTTLVVTL